MSLRQRWKEGLTFKEGDIHTYILLERFIVFVPFLVAGISKKDKLDGLWTKFMFCWAMDMAKTRTSTHFMENRKKKFLVGIEFGWEFYYHERMMILCLLNNRLW